MEILSSPVQRVFEPKKRICDMNSDHKSKICPTEPRSTIAVFMLHNSSSESCDDGHFIASTALGGHRKLMARFLS